LTELHFAPLPWSFPVKGKEITRMREGRSNKHLGVKARSIIFVSA
jgi:hypothetical protein